MSSTKYGKIMTEQNPIPADEPVFIIRGQDTLAVPVLDYYLSQCATRVAPDQDFLKALSEEIDRIQTWQEAHPERVKNPD